MPITATRWRWQSLLATAGLTITIVVIGTIVSVVQRPSVHTATSAREAISGSLHYLETNRRDMTTPRLLIWSSIGRTMKIERYGFQDSFNALVQGVPEPQSRCVEYYGLPFASVLRQKQLTNATLYSDLDWKEFLTEASLLSGSKWTIWWRGVIANIVIVGLLVLVLRRASRRYIDNGRRRAGLCVACCYPRVLSGSRCPECGVSY